MTREDFTQKLHNDDPATIAELRSGLDQIFTRNQNELFLRFLLSKARNLERVIYDRKKEGAA